MSKSVYETVYMKTDKKKCPNCGSFGDKKEFEDETDEIKDYRSCPVCNTVFNEWLVLKSGQKVAIVNN